MRIFGTLIFIGLFLSVACGQNMFKSLEKKEKDKTQLALTDLENNNPGAAVAEMLQIIPANAKQIILTQSPRAADFGTNLTTATKDIPDRRKTLSVLGTSFARRGGVDPLTIIIDLQRIQEKNSASSTGLDLDVAAEKEAIGIYFSIFPSNATVALPDIERAIQIYNVIGLDQIPSDKLYKAILVIADFITDVKSFDTDHNGLISIAEAAAIPSSETLYIFSQMGAARDAVVDLQQTTDIKQVGDIKTKIDSFIAEVNSLVVPSGLLEDRVRQFIVNSSNRVK